MEKGIIIFKHDSRFKFLECLQNWWPPTAVHKCEPIIRLINTPLRMCHGIGMYAFRSVTGISLVIVTRSNMRKIFFLKLAVFFRAHSRFILVRSQWRN